MWNNEIALFSGVVLDDDDDGELVNNEYIFIVFPVAQNSQQRRVYDQYRLIIGPKPMHQINIFHSGRESVYMCRVTATIIMGTLKTTDMPASSDQRTFSEQKCVYFRVTYLLRTMRPATESRISATIQLEIRYFIIMRSHEPHQSTSTNILYECASAKKAIC